MQRRRLKRRPQTGTPHPPQMALRAQMATQLRPPAAVQLLQMQWPRQRRLRRLQTALWTTELLQLPRPRMLQPQQRQRSLPRRRPSRMAKSSCCRCAQVSAEPLGCLLPRLTSVEDLCIVSHRLWAPAPLDWGNCSQLGSGFLLHFFLLQVEWAAPRSVPPLFSRILYVGNLRPVRTLCAALEQSECPHCDAMCCKRSLLVTGRRNYREYGFVCCPLSHTLLHTVHLQASGDSGMLKGHFHQFGFHQFDLNFQ